LGIANFRSILQLIDYKLFILLTNTPNGV
jgi:hypothetical protein